MMMVVIIVVVACDLVSETVDSYIFDPQIHLLGIRLPIGDQIVIVVIVNTVPSSDILLLNELRVSVDRVLSVHWT